MAAAKAGQWHCRLWWPEHLCTAYPVGPMALLGWASPSTNTCVDVIVAAACPVPSAASIQTLEAVLNKAEKRLESQLPTATAYAPYLVGQYLPVCTSDDSDEKCGGRDRSGLLSCSFGVIHCNAIPSEGSRCACVFTNECKRNLSVWAAVTASRAQPGGCWPRVCYVAVKGTHYTVDTHIVIYEQPLFGRGHLSCRTWSSALHANQEHKSTLTKPNWMVSLEQQQQLAPDIERVVELLNCGAFVAKTVASCVGTSCVQPSYLSTLWWHSAAALVASGGTVLYVLASAGAAVLDKWLCVLPYMGCVQHMSHTWHALQLRFHQLLAWPFVLAWGGTGPEQANVSMAHRSTQSRHAMWTAVVVDMAMGAVAGLVVLRHEVDIAQYVQRMVQVLTNDILRTGCIWLMGVPAGFKLNDELAARLGTLSLHVIQTWATVGALVWPVLRALLPASALLAMLLGLTVPAAMLVDILLLATIHVAALHQATAFLYASQLRALAALWRLFRARKRNPLRGRLDTYDCSVEQLVVGSLMFTPLLLLLPTTSVFYTFFTLVYSVLSIVRLCLQYLILILQSFPYAQVAIWFVQPRRFPSGIWFRTLHVVQEGQSNSSLDSLPSLSATGHCDGHDTPHRVVGHCEEVGQGGQRDPVGLLKLTCTHSSVQSSVLPHMEPQDQTETLVSQLGVETASLGELLAPFVAQLGGICSSSSAVALIYKLVSGGSIPLALQLEMGALPPHTLVSVRTFWGFCHEAVLASLLDYSDDHAVTRSSVKLECW